MSSICLSAVPDSVKHPLLLTSIKLMHIPTQKHVRLLQYYTLSASVWHKCVRHHPACRRDPLSANNYSWFKDICTWTEKLWGKWLDVGVDEEHASFGLTACSWLCFDHKTLKLLHASQLLCLIAFALLAPLVSVSLATCQPVCLQYRVAM